MSPNGLNVTDLKFVMEGDTLALYVASAYESEGTEAGYGIYRVAINGTAMSFTHDLDDKVTVGGLTANDSGALFAIGFDAEYAPRVYKKSTAVANWTQIDTTGLPAEIRLGYPVTAPSITAGTDENDNLALYVVPQNNAIYYLTLGAESWSCPPALLYPEGTGISFLYWDDLVIGTTLGLFEQRLSEPTASGPIIKANNTRHTLAVNYGAPVSITVAMNAGPYAGIDADWWVVAIPNYGGVWYYLNGSMIWTEFPADLTQCRPVYSGPVTDVSVVTVLNQYVLPRGGFAFYFAVDQMDGILNYPDGPILYDAVTVTVE